jgi:hypothetical protein
MAYFAVIESSCNNSQRVEIREGKTSFLKSTIVSVNLGTVIG